MAEPVKPRRRYRSSVRAEQARRTQASILEAARALFLEHGFADTTIAAVAERAGVAPETVYARYRTKAGLLEGVFLGALLRDDESVETLKQRLLGELLHFPDLARRLEGFVRRTARTVELTSPMYAVIAGAGTDVGELAALLRRIREIRFGGQRDFIAAIAEGQPLRPGLTIEDAADTFSALASPELHHILTVDRGWSQRRYVRWLDETVKAALLP
jgi:AcrR family transcriptional regulator